MNSGFPDVLGVPALSSQRLGSPMGFGSAMRKVPRKTRKWLSRVVNQIGGKPEGSLRLPDPRPQNVRAIPLPSVTLFPDFTSWAAQLHSHQSVARPFFRGAVPQPQPHD